MRNWGKEGKYWNVQIYFMSATWTTYMDTRHMEQADSPGTGESACCVLQVKRFPHYTIPFCSVLTHPLLQSIYKMYSAITKRDKKKKKIQIFHPWEIFLLQTRLSKACKKIAVLPCDVWTNRSKEWADVNVKPFYKACFNHNTCFFLLLKKEKSYPSYKFTVFLRTHFLH